MTNVEAYGDRAYEVEFSNDEGETLEMRALTPDQFVVVWKSATKALVPVGDRLTALMEKLSEDRQEQVLNFVRSLYKTPA